MSFLIIERDGQTYKVEEVTTKNGNTVVVETLYNPDYVPPEPEPPQPTPEQLKLAQLEEENAELLLQSAMQDMAISDLMLRLATLEAAGNV